MYEQVGLIMHGICQCGQDVGLLLNCTEVRAVGVATVAGLVLPMSAHVSTDGINTAR